MKKIILLLSLLLLCASFVDAQVKTNFNNPEQIGSRGKYSKSFRGKSPYIIPARDIKSLLERETQENASGEAKPFRIAEPVNVDIDVVREAEWLVEGDSAFAKFTILASGAKSISANFDQFYLPPGTELFAYSDNGEMITGPITENENNAELFWGTWVYKGSRLTIDLRVLLENKSLLRLHISSIAYGYKDIYRTEVGGFGESSACNINVLCPLGNGWDLERNSVALILNGNSSALCSGALINNTCNLNIPYLLTANHCFEANTNVGQWKFTFQAWSPACNPSQNANGITFNGSALRARSAGSDFCLVQLNQVPSGNSGITYSGWSRNTVGIQNTTIIHHPAGDVMKISRDEQPPVFATFLGSQSWQLVLDQGATNGGSSGGPYYDQNHRIIAQHHGINQNNADQCLNTNKFGGRFNVSWDGDGTNATRLSNWLDPSNSGAMTTDSRRIPFVTGPTLICTNGTFSLQNQPAGSTINWTSSNPNILTIDPNTGVANRQNSNSGSIVITASVQMPGGCNPALYTLSIWVGNPGASITTLIYPSGLRGVNPVSLGPASIYQFRCDPVGGFPTSWTWVLPSGFSFYSGSTTSTPYIMTSSTNGSYTMYCQVNNTCGSSWTNSLGINISSSGGGTPLRVRGDSQQTDSGEINIEETQINSSVPYPNPASETLNIELEGTSTLTILSIAGQKILSTTGTGKITIPITELSNGIYFLTISNVKGTARHKFIIQH